ncbi:hypothetical protein KUCAC02_009601 [Chaenocephalus aceratus]|nr:hypothetical protein KUCAC02_009601 [Chaenocephalus aceratus]
MEAFHVQVILLVGLCVSSSFAFPSTQDALFQSLANTGRSELGQQQQKSPAEEPQQRPTTSTAELQRLQQMSTVSVLDLWSAAPNTG